MAQWLLKDIEKYIDIYQFGNRPGLSTSHYLVGLLHHLYKNAENNKAISTVVCTDFRKAFDRLDHGILIQKMINMHIKPWMINWIISFLQCRTQSTLFNGILSNVIVNHAGVPQGTRLGPILFLIMVNDLCKDIPIHYFKYVDDLSLVQCRKSTDVSQLQPILNSVHNWSQSNNMSLNPAKCFTLHVSFLENPPLPEILSVNDSILCNVQNIKILGIIIQSNLKWNLHIDDLVKRCNRKLYMLRKLKKFNLPLKDLVTIYAGYIRPILEYCAPVFHSSLTKEQSNSLEKIQRRVCKIILGYEYINYLHACQICNLPTLEERRLKLCIKFAKSISNHPICQTWLPKKKRMNISLRHMQTYQQFKLKTERFKKSPLPFLVDILNKSYKKKKKPSYFLIIFINVKSMYSLLSSSQAYGIYLVDLMKINAHI